MQFEIKEKLKTPEMMEERRKQKEARITEATREFRPPPVISPAPSSPQEGSPKVSPLESPAGAAAAPTPATDAPDAPFARSASPQRLEAVLTRKHEWESSTKKASNRSWHPLYMVLGDRRLAAYKDKRHERERPGECYHHEAPLELRGASAAPASDYAKRPQVWRLKLANGAEFLFQVSPFAFSRSLLRSMHDLVLQCRSAEEMNVWIEGINAHATAGTPPTSSKAATLPAGEGTSSGAGPGKKKFFTLGRKK